MDLTKRLMTLSGDVQAVSGRMASKYIDRLDLGQASLEQMVMASAQHRPEHPTADKILQILPGGAVLSRIFLDEITYSSNVADGLTFLAYASGKPLRNPYSTARLKGLSESNREMFDALGEGGLTPEAIEMALSLVPNYDAQRVTLGIAERAGIISQDLVPDTVKERPMGRLYEGVLFGDPEFGVEKGAARLALTGMEKFGPIAASLAVDTALFIQGYKIGMMSGADPLSAILPALLYTTGIKAAVNGVSLPFQIAGQRLKQSEKKELRTLGTVVSNMAYPLQIGLTSIAGGIPLLTLVPATVVAGGGIMADLNEYRPEARDLGRGVRAVGQAALIGMYGYSAGANAQSAMAGQYGNMTWADAQARNLPLMFMGAGGYVLSAIDGAVSKERRGLNIATDVVVMLLLAGCGSPVNAHPVATQVTPYVTNVSPTQQGQPTQQSTAVPPAQQPTTIPPTQAAPQVNIDGILGKVCGTVYEGTQYCGTITIVDASVPGWQTYVNNIVSQYFGIAPADYVNLVKVVGDMPQPMTPCDGQANLSCIADNTTPQICLPIVADGKIAAPAGCNAVAILYPGENANGGAWVYDSRSVFHNQENFLGTWVSAQDMRTALGTVFPAVAVNPTAVVPNTGGHSLAELINEHTTFWSVTINTPGFDINALTYTDILNGLKAQGVVPQWLDMQVYNYIMATTELAGFSLSGSGNVHINPNSVAYSDGPNGGYTVYFIGDPSRAFPGIVQPTPTAPSNLPGSPQVVYVETPGVDVLTPVTYTTCRAFPDICPGK